MKYVLVTGGVISGVGKGIIASSLGTLLKSRGIRVTSIKIDPYINIDAGTFSPYEHGEVFVLDDGGEVDLDLGNYERFLDVTLTRDNNITTGKIYQQVISKERKGDYLGKTVQVVPHITNAIQDWVTRVAETPVDGNEKADVCIIELGGTIGDIEGMPFVEAFRQFQFRVKRENICCVHVSLIPQPKTTGEQKTKPTQSSVRELRGLGISPDIIVCRSVTPLSESVKEKISLFCHVDPEQVYCVHDVTSVFRVPLLLQSQGADDFLISRLQIDVSQNRNRPQGMSMASWAELADRHDRLLKEVCIVLVGKYTALSDSYTSVIKALQHASLAVNHRLDLKCIEAADLEPAMENENPQKYHEAWRELVGANGVIVPGGFGTRGTEGKILACKWARSKNIPFLGVCLGLQCAVIEFARSVLGWKDANSTELNPEISLESNSAVVVDMPEHTSGDMGGTMRLGKRKTVFRTDKSVIRKLYGNPDSVEERHRHRYEVNPRVVSKLEEKGMKFVGHSEDDKRMEIMELEGHPYFVGVQYHPEYISRPLKPSAPYLGLLLAASNQLQTYASRGYRASPRLSEDSEDGDRIIDASP
ncbi:CTP synthase 2 [Biomphalaria pfeifferi]|uniref:CTP synthase n=1 Tax=Biomphalaria pfeifferi TaxID=112525 RepID=A0AAD8C195_BIOPF|nr:CTP synthase 2 [Biomphalaria pfeifferi]